MRKLDHFIGKKYLILSIKWPLLLIIKIKIFDFQLATIQMQSRIEQLEDWCTVNIRIHTGSWITETIQNTPSLDHSM
jgi:hypothetical protein